MRKIVISGWYGCGNLGDEAILTAMLDTIRARDPGAHFVVVSEVPEQVERDYRDYPLRAVAQRSYYYPLELASGLASGAVARVWSAIQGADLFLLGGGGLLRDNTSKRNLVRIVDECALATLLGVPVAFFAIGVGPIETAWGACLVRWISNRAAVITVRDRVSAQILASIGVAQTPIHVTADPAFLLQPDLGSHDGGSIALAAGIPAGDGLFGIFPCEGLFWSDRGTPGERDRIIGEIAALCDHIARAMRLTPVFIPFRTGTEGDDDLVAVDQILARMKSKGRAVRVAEVPRPKAVRALMGRFRYVVGARLHSIILAAAAGTPFIGINYEPKIKHFIESIRPHGFLAELPGLSAAACAAFLEDCEKGYGARRAALAALAADRASAAERTFDLVLAESRSARAAAFPGGPR